jgi:hypothetical protein
MLVSKARSSDRLGCKIVARTNVLAYLTIWIEKVFKTLTPRHKTFLMLLTPLCYEVQALYFGLYIRPD